MRNVIKSLFSSASGRRSRRGKQRFGAATRLTRATTSEVLENRTLLAAQMIGSDSPTKTLSAGETINIPIVYQTLDDNGSPAALQANLISFNLHFDSNALTYDSSSSFFAEGIAVVPNSVRPETDASVTGDDGDANTDSAIVAAYTDNDSALFLGWPNSPVASGQTLYVATFTAKPGFTGTTINFSANATGTVIGQAAEFTFASTSVTLAPPATEPTVSISDATAVTEGQNAVFTVSLSEASSSAVTVNYSTADGSGPNGATAGEDYAAQTNQTVTFNPGETSKSITVSTVDNSVVEGTETFSVVLSSPSGAQLGTSTGTGTIQDDDVALPTLTIANAAAVEEGNSATFTVTLSAAASETVTVQYSTTDGNGPNGATAGSDFTGQTNQTLSFAPGETQKTISVSTTDDATPEDTETFGITLSNPAGASLATASASGTITDNDPVVPVLAIGNAPAVIEGANSVFTVSLSSASSSPVTVQYSTMDGSGPDAATAGADYTAQTSQTLRFAPGETQKTISIATIDDTIVESTEVFAVVLSNPSGATIGTAQADGTINDNDFVRPVISISDASSVTEGNASTFTVMLSAATTAPVVVQYSTSDGTGANNATAGQDYTPQTLQSLSFAAGETQKTISIVTVDDTDVERSETFEVNLANPTNSTIGDGKGVGTILDNDVPALTIGNAENVTEGGMSVFTVTLSDAPVSDVTVNFATSATGANPATAGADFASQSGTLTFTAGGSLTQQISIQTIDDSSDEPNETFKVTLSNATGATIAGVEGVGTIVDDDDPTGQGTIQGRKWNDLNGDGQRTSNEPWLNGWTIQIVDATGAVVGDQVTSDWDINADSQIDPETETGWYRFIVPAGTYSLQEVMQTGWNQTAPGSPDAARAYELDVQLGFRQTQNDFLDWGGRSERWVLGNDGWFFITPDGTLFEWNGSPRNNLSGDIVETFSADYYNDLSLLYAATPAQISTYTVTDGSTIAGDDFGNQQIIQQNGSIHGRKWNDLNGDGQRTADEPWLNGWTIELLATDGTVVQTTTTMDMDLNDDNVIDPETESGWYWFTDISVGDWTVREVQREGWKQTSPADPAAAEAYRLDNELNLSFSRSLFTNWGGLNERWVRGDSAWYYITPDGDFYRWNGSPRGNLSGIHIAQLAPEYHAEPSLLYEARNPYHVQVAVSSGEKVEGIDFGNQLDRQFPTEFSGQGNVSVRFTGQHLILTGDRLNNGVAVYTNTEGWVTVEGLGDTLINNQMQPWVLQGVEAIPGDVRATLRGGSDALIITDLMVGDDVTVNSDGGNDFLITRHVSVQGDLDYRSLSGDTTVILTETLVGNAARINTGGGNDALYTNQLQVGGRTTVNTGLGNDIFVHQNSAFQESVILIAGGHNDQVALLSGNEFGGAVTVDGRTGTDALDADSSNLFAQEPTVLRFEQDSIADTDGLLDSIMERVANAGLDALMM